MELESKSQKIWGWPIASYLLLGGLGGGCYLIGVLSDFFSFSSLFSRVGVSLGPPLVCIGTFFLLADLGRPRMAVRAILRPSTSWISRGTLILGVFILVGVVHIALWIWPFDWLARAIIFRRLMGAVNSIFALMTIIYTGLFLGSFRPIPLWCSPLIPAIFLVSGLSTGLMATGMGVVVLHRGGPVTAANPETTFFFPMLEVALLVLEGLMVVFYLQGSRLLEASRASVRKIVRGDLAAPFWFGFVVLGLLIPLGVNVIGQLFGSGLTHSLAPTLLSSVSGLVGGYFLRHFIVAAGIKAPLSVQGIMVPPIPEI